MRRFTTVVFLLSLSARVSAIQPELPPEERMRRAVDIELANNLIDPISAIDYKVSDPLPCKSLNPRYEDAPGDKGLCACFSVNSKNRMGGYTGASLSYVGLVDLGDIWVAILPQEIVDPEGKIACLEAGLTDRPASKISDRVKH